MFLNSASRPRPAPIPSWFLAFPSSGIPVLYSLNPSRGEGRCAAQRGSEETPVSPRSRRPPELCSAAPRHRPGSGARGRPGYRVLSWGEGLRGGAIRGVQSRRPRLHAGTQDGVARAKLGSRGAGFARVLGQGEGRSSTYLRRRGLGAAGRRHQRAGACRSYRTLPCTALAAEGQTHFLNPAAAWRAERAGGAEAGPCQRVGRPRPPLDSLPRFP